MPAINCGTKFSKDFQRYVEASLLYFWKVAGVTEYTLKVKYEDHCCDADDGELLAATHVDDTYLVVEVRISKFMLGLWAEGDRQSVARALLHEICHVLLHPIANPWYTGLHPAQKSMGRDAVERQCCRITNAIWGLLPKKFWEKEFVTCRSTLKPSQPSA